MKSSDEEKYLRECLEGSLSESIEATVSKRIGRVTQTMFEIKVILDNFRAKVSGGIMTRLLLLECVVSQYLLFNSKRWFQLKKTVDKAE